MSISLRELSMIDAIVGNGCDVDVVMIEGEMYIEVSGVRDGVGRSVMYEVPVNMGAFSRCYRMKRFARQARNDLYGK